MTDKKVVPTFAGKAYVMVLEKGLYGLYRDVFTEEIDPSTGQPVREKMGSIGPIKLLREMQKGEEQLVVLKTSHPLDVAKIISLVETKG